MSEAPHGSESVASTVLGELPPENVGSVIGPYKLLLKIGEGGFGVVYRAEQERPVRRTVALKIIKPGMDTAQVIARFESERQALALMDHPNIAKVLDAGATASGHPYFVMELVKGVPITEYCDQNHLAPDTRLKLFIEVCHAIQHAHHKGIIHRDIKPSNVLVTLHDGVPVVKVIDFGVAKATVQKLTERTLFTAFGQMVGTPAYMSPEQAEVSGLDIDTRSDVYSLGVLLYELLTGTTPLEVERLRQAGYAEIQRLIREQDPPRPSTRLSSLGDSATLVAGNRGLDLKGLEQLLSGDLDWVAMKALEKDRNRRYATPDSFAEDVQRYLRNEPILARPPSRAYRLKKLVQRNRAAVLTGGAVAFALVVGASAATWQAVRATRAERDAKAAKDDALLREAETKAALDFVENRVFAAARPVGQAGGLGRDVSLRKAIESALPYMEKSFTDQPLIEARLRLTLGRSFHYLGDSKAAAAQQEAARALFTRDRGYDHPDTLRSTGELAASYGGLGRWDEVLRLEEETLALRKARLGPDHPDTLRSMTNLAVTYGVLGRLSEAVRLQEEALAMCQAKLGPRDPQTLWSMLSVATAYNDAGRPQDAIKLIEQVLATRKSELGLGHPDTLWTMSALADSYYATGRHRESLKLREEALELEKLNLGPDHPTTLGAMTAIAESYAALGRYDEALKIRQETLPLYKAKFGSDHPGTIDLLMALANSYQDVGRHAEALKLREETLALTKAKWGPDHPETLHCMHNLAISYWFVGRHADSIKLRQETLALRRAKLGPDHPDTLFTMSNLALNYDELGRYADSVKLNEEVLKLDKAKLGPDHPRTLLTMNNLAVSYCEVGRFEEALKLDRDTLARYQATLGRDSPDTLLSMASLGECLYALGAGTSASSCARRRSPFARSSLSPTTPTPCEACSTWPKASFPSDGWPRR